jgi:hypothetical protein
VGDGVTLGVGVTVCVAVRVTEAVAEKVGVQENVGVTLGVDDGDGVGLGDGLADAKPFTTPLDVKYRVSSAPMAGRVTTATPLLKLHNKLPVLDTAITRPSATPTYTLPDLSIAGED